jgi:hypothetical protein
MAAAHAPDLAAYKRRSKSRGRARGASGSDNGLDKNYALPYMNLEDLARGNAFLVLLNSRVRHPPSQFAVLDEQSLRFGIWAEALTPPGFLLPGAAYRMDLWSEDPEKYGQIDEYETSATEEAAGKIPNVSHIYRVPKIACN